MVKYVRLVILLGAGIAALAGLLWLKLGSQAPASAPAYVIAVTGGGQELPALAGKGQAPGGQPAIPNGAPDAAVNAAIHGPLRVSAANPRYFADASGRIIYLTGSHTWANLQDNGRGFPPPVFDYTAYLDLLVANHHNFFRLWTWEQSRWTLETTDPDYWFNPMGPYARPGPGTALDGKPKYDLTQFNQAYFDRMRARILQARDRGIYVSVMLFDGWSVAKLKGHSAKNNPWQGHPFNLANNINQVNGDPNGRNDGLNTQDLSIRTVTNIQEAYVRKVIDTVNDLDNVLYEICNEGDGSSVDWQYHMIDLIKSYEATKPQQHPVGMTIPYPGGWTPDLYDSHADWISPNNDDGYYSAPPAADGSKVILTDTDHLCGICGDSAFVWKSFTRGLNPILMDGYDGKAYGVGAADYNPEEERWPILRANLGYTLRYAERMNLARMIPHQDLCSTGYCLANPSPSGAEFLVYAPAGKGSFTVDLSAVKGTLRYEWLDPQTGKKIYGDEIQGGARTGFAVPFSADAVLYLYDASLRSNFEYLPSIMH